MSIDRKIWNAEDYSKSNGSQYRDAKETIELIIQNGANKEGMIVADIGSGSGNVTKMLSCSLSISKIFACDFDAQMVAYSEENCSDEKIEYFVQDISVPWESLDDRLINLEGKVDLVWSNRVLHWLSDSASAIKTISRLLKPGGHCYANISIFRDLNEFASEEERREREKYFNIMTFRKQKEIWDSHFKNSGLSELKMDFMEKKWQYNDKKQKVKFYSAAEPYVNLIAKEAYKQLAQEEKAKWIKIIAEEFDKHSQTPYGQNPKMFLDENNLNIYYEQLRIRGIK